MYKIFSWKFAQWGQVNDEKTLTVIFAFSDPMLNTLSFATNKFCENKDNIKIINNFLIIFFIEGSN